ncbi:MAG: BldC family transcriptional regulator [Caldilineaceae bacterium]
MNPNLTSGKAADAYLTRAQVAELFSVSPSTVTRWADEGKLTCVRTLGGHRRYQKDEIIELVHTWLQEGERVETIRVEVPKLYADHHTLAVRQVLAGLPGVQDVWVSAAAREVQITFDPDVTVADGIVAALAAAGYPARNGQEPRPTGVVSKDPAWTHLDLRVTQTMRT